MRFSYKFINNTNIYCYSGFERLRYFYISIFRYSHSPMYIINLGIKMKCFFFLDVSSTNCEGQMTKKKLVK